MTINQHTSDTDLVILARRGNVDAQEELLQRHRKPMYFFALQLMGNPDDAMDVCQDALIRFLTTLQRFDAKRPVRPWLYQIVRNRVIDIHRRRKVRRAESLDATDDENNPRLDPADPSIDLEGDYEHGELRVRIWKALEKLTPTQREVLILRDYQDLAYQEIADTLAIPLGTVMSRLHSARRRLRDVLSSDGGAPLTST